MGVLPGSASDVNLGGAPFITSADGTGNQSVSNLATNNRAAVEQTYKTTQLDDGQSTWTNNDSPLAQIFGGIAGLPQAFGQLVSSLFGVNGPFNTIASALNQIEQGVIAGIQNAITAAQILIQNVIDAIISAIRLVPFVGGTAADVLSNLTGFHNATVTATGNAQTAADSANVGLAILSARVSNIITGGASYADSLSRVGSDLGPDYLLKYGASAAVLDGSGSGTVGTDTANAGTTVWNSVGFADRAWCAINTANPMASNRVRISLVLDPFTFAGAGNQENVYLIGHSDATLDNFVLARIGNLDVSGPGTCEIGYVKAGVYTRIGNVTGGIGLGGTDLWDLELGTPANPRQFRLLQNNALRVDVVDVGLDSHMDTTPGTTYKFTGAGEDCGIGAGFFGSTFQQSPPNIQVIAAADF